MFPFSEFSITSTILYGNQYYLRHLHRFLANATEVGEDSSWLLCYRATLHGWKDKTFHDRCDGKTNTVTIIQKGQYVFGGYTDIPWGKNSYWFLTSTVVPRKCKMISVNNSTRIVVYFSIEREIRLFEWWIICPRHTPFTLYLISSLRFTRSIQLKSILTS